MKRCLLYLTVLFSLILINCNNYFHELIPPDGNLILSFSVEGQIGKSVITDNSINAIIGGETDITAIIPNIQISPKATLFPLTISYLKETFPSIDIFQATVELHKAQNLTVYLEELIRDNPDFKIPALDKPIDFSGPVNFIVMSGQGSIRQYTVNVAVDSGLPHLISFGFYKFDNPELIRDAVTNLNERDNSVNSSILYPAEMHYLSYELIPVFEILGDRIEVDGMQVRSGIDLIKFSQGVGTKIKTVTVWREGIYADFTLTAVFSEDPDSIRSITDFRFNKTDNPGIAANAVASIINNDSLGTINIQVFYTGAKPILLNPRFVSPGTVSVSGAVQTSGSNTHDFSTQVEYRVVSRNNKYTRLYTVFVDFVDIASASPVISSFKFSTILNHELTDDSQAVISDGSGQIMITGKYRGASVPETLAPEFTATGIVTVNNAVQTSGFSAQNFFKQVKYTVTNPENPLLTRDYWVQASFSRDTSSDAAITLFSFHTDENTGLNEELIGKIDNNLGKITIFAPIGSGVTARTMYPRFTAAGKVSVNGVTQSSSSSGMFFDSPVIYKVVSANGINSREYTVTVRELRSTIFVNLNAAGEGDGTSWKDAFRDLKDACKAAAEFDGDIPKEIWIAKGTYKPSDTKDPDEYFPLAPNTSYLGGFAGNEANKSGRNAGANPVIISGDLGGGVYSKQLFGSFYTDNTAQVINGDAVFDNLSLIDAKAAETGVRNGGAAIYTMQSGGKETRITNCTFTNLQSAGPQGAVYVQGGNVIVNNSTFTACSSAALGGIIYINGSGSAEINNVTISSITSGGAVYNEGNSLSVTNSEFKNITGTYCIYSSGGFTAASVNFQNITGRGINVTGGPLNLSNVNIGNISARSVYFNSSANRVVIENSVFNDCGDVYFAGSSSAAVTDTRITNMKSGISNGLYSISTGNIYIDNVTVDNVPSGTGITVSSLGAVNIARSAVKNTASLGIYISNAVSAEISNSRTENTGSTAGIYNLGNNFKIINSTVTAATGSYGVYSIKGITITGLELHNITNMGIYITGAAMNISGVNASNIGGRSVYFSGSAYNAALSNSTFNICGDVYLENSYNASITNTKITNVKSGFTNGLHAKASSSGSINIENVTIENVPNGRGMNLDSAGNIRISDSRIENTKTEDPGGGILLQGDGNVVISGTVIKNCVASSGGGLVLVIDYAYGGFTTGGNATLDILNSRFENCRAVYAGAINNLARGGFNITDTDFIDCTSGGHSIIMNMNRAGSFIRCNFVHTESVYSYDANDANYINYFFYLDSLSAGQEHPFLFEDCNFTNLRSNNPSGECYLLGSIMSQNYQSVTAFISNSNDITMRNCNIILKLNEKVGLFASYYGGFYSYYGVIVKNDFLLDNVKITNNGSTQPLFWLNGSGGKYYFKPNNVYNGTTINTAASITNLGSSVIRLQNGATPVLVP